MSSPLPDDLLALLKPYARAGIREWRNARDELKRLASSAFGKCVASNPYEADFAVQDAGTKRTRRLIPMPMKPRNPGYSRAFFSPFAEEVDGEVIVKFDVAFLGQESNQVLALRFEPAHQTGTHSYNHAQLCRKILDGFLEVDGGGWLPTSYPAPPLPCSDSVGLFLCVATAVHGYHGGIRKVIMEIHQYEGRVPDAKAYLDRLEKMLSRADENPVA